LCEFFGQLRRVSLRQAQGRQGSGSAGLRQCGTAAQCIVAQRRDEMIAMVFIVFPHT
jgi:hypothetical protein